MLLGPFFFLLVNEGEARRHAGPSGASRARIRLTDRGRDEIERAISRCKRLGFDDWSRRAWHREAERSGHLHDHGLSGRAAFGAERGDLSPDICGVVRVVRR